MSVPDIVYGHCILTLQYMRRTVLRRRVCQYRTWHSDRLVRYQGDKEVVDMHARVNLAVAQRRSQHGTAQYRTSRSRCIADSGYLVADAGPTRALAPDSGRRIRLGSTPGTSALHISTGQYQSPALCSVLAYCVTVVCENTTTTDANRAESERFEPSVPACRTPVRAHCTSLVSKTRAGEKRIPEAVWRRAGGSQGELWQRQRQRPQQRRRTRREEEEEEERGSSRRKRGQRGRRRE
eukprot:3940690-Rhodomonas_salina.1